MLVTYLQFAYLEKLLQPTDFCRLGVKLPNPSTTRFPLPAVMRLAVLLPV